MTEAGETGRSLRVLVVEDEMLVAVMLEEMLIDLGHEVAGTAANIEQATEMVERGGFDVAILDVNLNGTETYDIAERLDRRSLPFSFSTGYGRESLPERYRARPMLQKPFEQEALGRMIAEAMAGADRTA